MSVRYPGARASEGEEEAPKPATRKEEKEKKREGEKSEETPKPNKTNPAKNPTAFSTPDLAKTLYPNTKPGPTKTHNM